MMRSKKRRKSILCISKTRMKKNTSARTSLRKWARTSHLKRREERINSQVVQL